MAQSDAHRGLQWPLRPPQLSAARPQRFAVPSRLWYVVGVIPGMIGLGVILVLDRRGDLAQAKLLGDWIGALTGVIGGLMITLTNLAPHPTRRFRALVGAAITLNMLPELLNLLSANAMSSAGLITFKAVGQVALILGVIDRVSVRHSLSSSRNALEAGALGLVLSAAVWRWWFLEVTPPEQMLAIQLLLPVVGILLGTSILAWATFSDRDLAVACTAASVLSVAGLAAKYLAMTPTPDRPVFAAATVLTWPVILVAVARAKPHPTANLSQTDAIRVRRSLLVVSTVSMCAVAVVGISLLTGRPIDTATVWYLGVAMVLIWVREIVRASQSGTMVLSLVQESLRDPLTGLPNLRQLDGDLHLLVGGTGPLAAVTVDLLRFKQVNDVLGRPTADNLLRESGIGLEALAAEHGGRTYRVGADEYVLLFSRLRAEQGLEIAAQVSGAVQSAAARVPGVSRVAVSAACGVASLQLSDATTIDELRLLLGQSAMAMHHARMHHQAVGNFDESLAAKQEREWHIEGVLRDRLASSGSVMQVQYQPIWSLVDGQLAGVEALARLQDPHLGSVPPPEFIQVAETQGLIHDIGDDILRQALQGATASGLIAAGKRLSVNVSTLQLRNPGFVDEVRALLQEHEVPASLLTMEVTESVFVSRDDVAVTALVDLHELGVKLVLDDFGTGYSSLSYLTRLPVRGLKLDKSLTVDLTDPKTRALASSIATMASSLGLDVVVEGVETVEQEQQIRDLGLDLVQGWRYGRPVDLRGLEALVTPTTLPSPRNRRHEHGIS